jgi:hypothetical protein
MNARSSRGGTMLPYVIGVALLALGAFGRLPHAAAAVAAGAGIVVLVVYAIIALRARPSARPAATT